MRFIETFIENLRDTKFVKFLEEIFDTFFNPETVYYENFNFGSGGVVTLRIVIVGFMVGFCVAAVSTLYEKRLTGSFVKKLLYEECLGQKKAKTLYELGYLKSPAIRSALKHGATLKRWVRCVEEDEFYDSLEQKRKEFIENNPDTEYIAPVFKRDCDTMHFYIPEDLKYQADVKFETQGVNVVSTIGVIVLSIIMCSVLCSVVPDMLTFADNFMSVIKN